MPLSSSWDLYENEKNNTGTTALMLAMQIISFYFSFINPIYENNIPAVANPVFTIILFFLYKKRNKNFAR